MDSSVDSGVDSGFVRPEAYVGTGRGHSRVHGCEHSKEFIPVALFVIVPVSMGTTAH